MSGVTDPIADMLTRIRNAVKAGYIRVDIPPSRIKVAIARILKNEGFIKNYKIIDDKKHKLLRLYLKYGQNKEPVIFNLKRISKPGRRVYVKAEELKPVLNNVGIWILSTSKGVISNKVAKKLNIGGEVICEIS
ncbi:MAG: 30S ribosomal protein S8 [Spirochaetota bacterium]|nr:30S ribosomal protein S8 [Spirochaetota bacterium]